MYRVLIVDDEENVIASLKKSIPWASMNLEVAGEADSMASALELARKRPFHIVVSDIKMPGGSGLELFRELMALAPDTQGTTRAFWSADTPTSLTPRRRSSAA